RGVRLRPGPHLGAVSSSPLEPSGPDMRAMAGAAVDFVTSFIEKLPDAPASDLEDLHAAVQKLREPVPDLGGDFEELLSTLADAAAKGFNTSGPGYLAYIPGGGLFAAAVADFLACTVNRF